MLTSEILAEQTTAEMLEKARNAMDIDSISALKYEKRGRLEAGVKPAPPSTEKPAYVRITKRGDKFLVDCRVHGRGGWCIHAVILALHFIGEQPKYKVKRKRARVKSGPELGFQLTVSFDTDQARFRVRARSTGRFLTGPLRFLLQEPSAFALPAKTLENIEDLAEAGEDSFSVSREDMASLLSTLPLSDRECPFHQKDGEPLCLVNAQHPPPKVFLSIEKKRIRWRTDPSFSKNAVFLPGWPGFLVDEGEIRRYPGYLADLQHLQGKSEGSRPLNPENLIPFLRQKHAIQWDSPRPLWLHDPDPLTLELDVHAGSLRGRLGYHFGEHFLPLDDPNQAHHLVQQGDDWILISLSPFYGTEVRSRLRGVPAPWQGASFKVRRQAAKSFLENLSVPGEWDIGREIADLHFGITRLALVSEWSDDVFAPTYTAGEHTFTHESLLSGMEVGGLVRLPSGDHLHVDLAEVRKNEQVLSGIRALHETKTAQKDLLARITGRPVKSPKTASLNETWRGMLRAYQREGVQWLLANAAREEPSLLADDMGLGKTIQTLAFLDAIKNDQPQMVVAPASLLENWRAECKKFCPHRKVILHHGPNRDKHPARLQQRDLVITSYGTMLRDCDMLYDVAFQVVVLDEAQAIKNPSSRTATAIRELWATHRVALTGTPVENRLTELWSIFQFLAPGYLGEEESIRDIRMPGSPAFLALKAKTAPFLLRRLKGEVEKDLPEKQEITIALPLEEKQRALYEQIRRDARTGLEEEKKANTVSILTKLLRLRQACCHPGLLDDAYLGVPSTKLNFLLEQLEEVLAAGHAVLVFSQFTSLLKIVAYYLEEREWDHLYLDGKTRNRQKLVDRFQNGEAPVFLISLKAGGTGLNLTRASYVYLLDPWWNPMAEAQATDRAHRIGQTQTVISYKLIAEGTVEEKILALQEEKRALAEGLWEEGAMLDRETILELLI